VQDTDGRLRFREQLNIIRMKHLKIWSVLFFVFGYSTSLAMFCTEIIYLKMGGLTLFAYLNYILINQYNFDDE
jgi:hypothetical protein